MTDKASAAREAFDAWCELPHTRRARATRREQWGSFLAGWIASQAPPQAAGAAAPAAGPADPDSRCDQAPPAIRAHSAWCQVRFRHCRKCTCTAEDSRKNSRTAAGPGVKYRKDGSFLDHD